jgi:hypothetical protein
MRLTPCQTVPSLNQSGGTRDTRHFDGVGKGAKVNIQIQIQIQKQYLPKKVV